ncbi:MAG: alpha/beta hydrolase-fold protein [Thermoplasmata archaeon]
MESSIQSPTLRKIRPDDQRALQQFWTLRQAEGTPLIESLPEDPTRCLVTFLWRSSRVCHVEISSLLKPDWREPNYLVRLRGTDIWYRSYMTRSDIRTVYFFTASQQPAANATPQEWMAYSRTLGPDPLNRRQFLYPADPEDPEDRAQAGSVVSLPNAPLSPQLSPHAAESPPNLEMHRFQSRLLGNERRVWLYRPPARLRPSSKPPRLLVVFDGQAYLTLIPTTAILEDLQSRGRLGPMYAVLVDSVSAVLRNKELLCDPAFARFVVRELLPWVEKQFGHRFPAKQSTIVGSSLGGLAASYVAWRNPERFGNVVSQSGVFSRSLEGQEPGWLIRRFAEEPRKPIRFHLEAGLLETGGGGDPGILESNRNFRNVLRAKGNLVLYSEFPGGHDYLWWGDTLGPALAALARRS